jgi:hypothetical protein
MGEYCVKRFPNLERLYIQPNHRRPLGQPFFAVGGGDGLTAWVGVMRHGMSYWREQALTLESRLRDLGRHVVVGLRIKVSYRGNVTGFFWRQQFYLRPRATTGSSLDIDPRNEQTVLFTMSRHSDVGSERTYTHKLHLTTPQDSVRNQYVGSVLAVD